jgi:hypothetical protein
MRRAGDFNTGPGGNDGGEQMKREYTKCRDANKAKIYYGDKLIGSYGIPPVCVKTVAEKAKGKPIVRTQGHNPEVCALRSAVRCLYLTVNN